ncbi:helix-turn-helix domain-containing protein [Methyloceanibacter sp.]|uniref:helix-turn-helix domain-containing protein n=1 Tax=Methyloceanibacter sp. TaxID=1965321 RepID=UPI002D1FABE9|nr:helix-turn-helix domain-containing protein [Methyloceanibacter sp.]
MTDIEKAAGREAAMTLMYKYGGTHIYVPTPDLLERFPQNYRNNRLVQIVGLEAAIEIARNLVGPMGSKVYIPTAASFVRGCRRLWVRDYADKFSLSETARRLGVSERYVSQIRRDLRQEGLIE